MLRVLRIAFILFAVAVAIGIVSDVLAHHLFDTDAGFAKAKLPNRQSITVYADPAARANVPQIIAPWNKAAGWALFQASYSRPADVEIVLSGATWVQALPNYTEPYSKCIIYDANADTHTLTHEIGHCLGFADHIYSAQSRTGYVNPAVCDNKSDPLYSPYRGVESYCDWFSNVWFGKDDCLMLLNAGYRQQACLTPTPTPRPYPWPIPWFRSGR